MTRRLGAAVLDGSIELAGGLMGSYFGALVAALVVAMRDGPAEQMQSSIWSGFGFGFVFWTLSISFLNRVLIQGLSRASLGKKVFKLEMIATEGSLTWTTVMKRWVVSFASLSFGGLGYAWMLVDREGRGLHDLIAHTDIIPAYEGTSMSVEHRDEEAPMTFAQITQMLVLSNSQAERPMATVIQLPVRDRLASTGTEGSRMIVRDTVALAPVIHINPSAQAEALEEDDENLETLKKVA